MNEKQAIAAMKKLWGKKAAWRRNEKALVGKEREVLRASMPTLHAIEKEATALRDARYKELLQDPEYVRLSQAAKIAVKNRQEASGRIHNRRVTVGIIEGAFFVAKGDGDNWAEAIAKAEGGAE